MLLIASATYTTSADGEGRDVGGRADFEADGAADEELVFFDESARSQSTPFDSFGFAFSAFL